MLLFRKLWARERHRDRVDGRVKDQKEHAKTEYSFSIEYKMDTMLFCIESLIIEF